MNEFGGWFKSSFSGFDGACVEIAMLSDGVAVRDTKDAGAGPVLVFTATEWDAFIDGAKDGEFDRGR
jgi:Domain of unknown function (DUF397)